MDLAGSKTITLNIRGNEFNFLAYGKTINYSESLFSMHNHHTSVRCPDRHFFLVLPGMIYPLMIIPLVDTWSNGEFRNIFKNTITFLAPEKSVSLPVF
jgi:hypothetical protein